LIIKRVLFSNALYWTCAHNTEKTNHKVCTKYDLESRVKTNMTCKGPVKKYTSTYQDLYMFSNNIG